MSEHIQNTAAHNQLKMLSRYGTERYHKHNKNPNFKRRHCRTHPVQYTQISPQPLEVNQHTGFVHLENIEKYFHPCLAKSNCH